VAASGGLVYGRAWVSSAIRWLTRHGIGLFWKLESRGVTNHVFVVRRDGTGGESIFKGAVELPDIYEKYDNEKHWGVTFEVLTPGFDHAKCDDKLNHYIEEAHSYDFAVIAKCAIDGVLSRLFGRDLFIARRLSLQFWTRKERWNICAWLFAYTHKAGGHSVHGTVTDTWVERRGWHHRLYRRTERRALDLRRVTPNDVERDVFLERPGLHRITGEFGVRPDDLPWKYVQKIQADLALP